jgi:hypothetical protein
MSSNHRVVGGVVRRAEVLADRLDQLEAAQDQQDQRLDTLADGTDQTEALLERVERLVGLLADAVDQLAPPEPNRPTLRVVR